MKQAELFSEPETISATVAALMKQQAVVIQNGTWTVQNGKTGDHRTFRIRTQHAKAKFAPGQRIVSVMSGTDSLYWFRIYHQR